jgi:hypothetical protein
MPRGASEPRISDPRDMFELFALVLAALRAGLRSRADLLAENLLLRQQLAVLARPTRQRQQLHGHVQDGRLPGSRRPRERDDQCTDGRTPSRSSCSREDVEAQAADGVTWLVVGAVALDPSAQREEISAFAERDELR